MDLTAVRQRYRDECTQSYHESTARCIALMERLRDLPDWPDAFWQYYAGASEYAAQLEDRYVAACKRLGPDHPEAQAIAAEAERFEVFDTYPVWQQVCEEVNIAKRLGAHNPRVARLERLLSVTVTSTESGE